MMKINECDNDDENKNKDDTMMQKISLTIMLMITRITKSLNYI